MLYRFVCLGIFVHLLFSCGKEDAQTEQHGSQAIGSKVSQTESVSEQETEAPESESGEVVEFKTRSRAESKKRKARDDSSSTVDPGRNSAGKTFKPIDPVAMDNDIQEEEKEKVENAEPVDSQTTSEDNSEGVNNDAQAW